MKKISVVFCWLLYFQQSAGQDSTSNRYEIATDRPTTSFSAYTVPLGILVMESGYLRISSQTAFGRLLISLPNLFCRYGISNRLELRLGQELEISKIWDNNHLQESITFWQPVHLGIKYRLNKGDKLALSTMWASRLPVPSGFASTSQRHYARLMMQYNFSRLYAFSNVGIDLVCIRQQNEVLWTYSLGFGGQVLNGFYACIENYGSSFFPVNDANHLHGFNVALVYIMQKRYQLDVLFGGSLEVPIRDYFYFSIGFSNYFNVKK